MGTDTSEFVCGGGCNSMDVEENTDYSSTCRPQLGHLP